MNIKRITSKHKVKDSAYEMEYGNTGHYSVWLLTRRNKEQEDFLVDEGQVPNGIDFLEFLESEYNLSWRKSLSGSNKYLAEISNQSPIVYFMAELS